MRIAADNVRRKKVIRRCLTVSALLAVGGVCWFGGWETRDAAIPRQVETGGRTMIASKAASTSGECDAYEQYGVLNVNTTEPTGNFWEAIGRDDCQRPVDYMELIRQVQADDIVDPAIEFMRNRTIVIYGDSVDRDHNQHFCELVGGRGEMIADTHELSPPYPEGREIPPEDYADFFKMGRVWPNYDQPRPAICHLDKLDFRILNIFHYGFRPETKWIRDHPHFYPPATVEDRFDQILVPLVRNIGLKYGGPTVPDILSIAPGFWGLLRQSVEDHALADAALAAGTETMEEATAKHWVFRTMGKPIRDWNERRIEEILRHISLKGWRGETNGKGKRGQSLYFRDEVHPLPLPGSYLYGNMLLLQLRQKVADEQS